MSSRLTEAALAAMEVRHPNILAVLDVALLGQELCIVSEYVDGESLHSLQRLAFARRAALAPAMALRIAFDVISALRAARAMWQERTSSAGGSFAQCLHGGLSPDSILIAAYGDVILADLGVSGAAAEFREFVHHPELLPYRAPELVSGGSPADERADVFSLGVLVWELLTNQGLFGSVSRTRTLAGPFDPASASARAETEEIQSKLATFSIPRLDAAGRQGIRVSAQSADFVERALKRDPSERFQSLSDMQNALLALPRDSLASPEQLSLAMERLARSSTEERRRVMERFVRSLRPGSGPPESGRPTRRPAAAAEPAVIPELKAPRVAAFSSFTAEARSLGFGEQEAPTRPGEEFSRVARDFRKKTIQGMPAVKFARASLPAVADKPEAQAPPPQGEAPDESQSALKPARVVPIGSKPPARSHSAVSTKPYDPFPVPPPVEPAALRAAFEAARQAELAEPEAAAAFPSPSVAPPRASVAPAPAALTPAPAPVQPLLSAAPLGLESSQLDPRQQRARRIALVIGAIILLIALIAILRAIL